MPEPSSTPRKIAQAAAAAATLSSIPVAHVVVGAAIVGGCLIYYCWFRREPVQQRVPTPAPVSMDGAQARIPAPLRRRVQRANRPPTHDQDDNVTNAGPSNRRRIFRIFSNSRREGRGPESDGSLLNTVSEWRTEEERNAISRRFVNNNTDATDQLTQTDQQPAMSSAIPIGFQSSPGGNLSELGSPSPADFASPGPLSPPYLFRP